MLSSVYHEDKFAAVFKACKITQPWTYLYLIRKNWENGTVKRDIFHWKFSFAFKMAAVRSCSKPQFWICVITRNCGVQTNKCHHLASIKAYPASNVSKVCPSSLPRNFIWAEFKGDRQFSRISGWRSLCMSVCMHMHRPAARLFCSDISVWEMWQPCTWLCCLSLDSTSTTCGYLSLSWQRYCVIRTLKTEGNLLAWCFRSFIYRSVC